jgi:phage replication O-like protein O
MPHLSGGELKVLLYMYRRTFGFRKDSDRISLSQIAQGITTKTGRVLDQGTGLTKRHVITALKSLEKKNIIKVSRTVDETGLHAVNTYTRSKGMQQPQGTSGVPQEIGYTAIGEVKAVVNTASCNQLLAAGWVLLGVYPLTTVGEMTQEAEQKKQDTQLYVRRLVGYVVGRRRE